MTMIEPFSESILAAPSRPSVPADTAGSVSVYLGDIRRRWFLLAAGVIVGVLGSAAYLAVGQPVTATTDVDVSSAPLLTSASGSNATFDAGTDIGLASSFPVASAAAEALGSGADPAELRRNATVTAVDGTPIIHIAYTDQSPVIARTRADAMAEAYLGFRDDAVASSLAASERVGAPHSRILTSAANNPVSTPASPATVLASGAVTGGVLGALAAVQIAVAGRRREARTDIVRRVGPVLSDAAAAPHPDGEALARLARERILMHTATPLTSIALIDVSDGNDGITVPQDLAAAFREIGWACVVDRGEVSADDDGVEYAPLHLVSVGPRPTRSEALRAARSTDGVVIVHQTGRASVDDAAALSAELRAAGTQVLGVSLVPGTDSDALRRPRTTARDGAGDD